MGYNINQVLASKWMSGTDIPPQGVDLPILNVTKEAVGEMLDEKLAIHFGGGHKPLLANRTNLRIVSSLFGPDTSAWTGQVVNVYFDPSVQYGGKLVGGIRLRPAVAQAYQPHNNMPGVPQGQHQGYPGHQDNPGSYQPQASAQQYRQASGAPIPNRRDLEDDIPF